MPDETQTKDRALREKLLSALLALPWMDVVAEIWALLKTLIRERAAGGPYRVLDYASTLELLDPEGKHATFRKAEKVRYLQDNLIAYQDQAWGDGEILVNYRCTPGKPVDCYRTGHKWHVLVSRREVRNRGDEDTFHIEWEIRNGFLKETGYWETHVTHPTDRLAISVVFPESRAPRQVSLIETNRSRSTRGNGNRLPDGHYAITWELAPPRLHERYVVQWEW